MRKKISLFRGSPGDQRESIAAQGSFRVGFYVEPHFGLAVALVRAVAGVAAVRENRADIAVVLNLGGQGVSRTSRVVDPTSSKAGTRHSENFIFVIEFRRVRCKIRQRGGNEHMRR